MRFNEEQLREHKCTHDKCNSWWLCDARGIEVSRVCDSCIDDVKHQYNPAIFGESDIPYEEYVEDTIEPEDESDIGQYDVVHEDDYLYAD